MPRRSLGQEAERVLRADGPVLRDAAGAAVVLQGTNLGGWLMHEDWITPMGDPSIDRDAWTASAPTSAPGCQPGMALDGVETTAWRSGAGTLETRHLLLDLGDIHTFDGVSLVVSRSGDGPTQVEVETSTDATDWRPWGAVAAEDGQRLMRGDFRAARFASA